MQQPTQIFTPDALFSLQNAQSISKGMISSDHIFRGSYAFIRETDQFGTFSSMLGLKNAQHLDQQYQTHFQTLIKGKPLAREGRVEIEGTFNQHLLQHKAQRNIPQMDFCFLFYTSFLHLSNESQIFQLLKSDQLDPQTIMKNCEKLLFNPLSKQQGAFAFLKVLSKIFEQLHLDPNQITAMQININENLDNLEKLLDSVESEIGLESENKTDNNDSTTTATKKKEEKKLNIEYF